MPPTTLFTKPMAFLVGAGVVFGSIYKFFKIVDENQDPALKRKVSFWLIGVDASTDDPVERMTALHAFTWPATFLAVFESVFGSRPSWTGFRRSILATYLSYIVLCVVGAALESQDSDPSWKTAWPLLAQLSKDYGVASLMLVLMEALFLVTLGVFVFAAIPDYMAVMATHRILGRAVRHSGRVPTVLTIVAVFLTSYCCAALTTLGYLLLLRFFALHSPFVPSAIPKYALGWDIGSFLLVEFLLCFVSTRRAVEVALYGLPAFISGVWVLLYVLSGSSLILARDIRFGFRRAIDFIDLKNHPLQGMGLIGATVATIVYIIVVIIQPLK